MRPVQEAPDVHGLVKSSQQDCHPEAQHSQQSQQE